MLGRRQRVLCHECVVRGGLHNMQAALSGGDQINSYGDGDGLVLMSRSGSQPGLGETREGEKAGA